MLTINLVFREIVIGLQCGNVRKIQKFSNCDSLSNWIGNLFKKSRGNECTSVFFLYKTTEKVELEDTDLLFLLLKRELVYSVVKL